MTPVSLLFRLGRPSRRQFVQGGSAALAAAALRRPARPLRRLGHRPRAGTASACLETLAARVDPARVKQLALRAVDAAKTAGATYADVRLTRTVSLHYGSDYRSVNALLSGDSEILGVGVRCLVNGYWGFAASAVWTPDEAVALARTAAALAQANAKGPPRVVDWRPMPIASGDWAPPHALDPFTIPIEEQIDYLNAFATQLARLSGGFQGEPSRVGFWRQEQALATTEGVYCTQLLFPPLRPPHWYSVLHGPTSLVRPSVPTGGWETRRAIQEFYAQIPAMRAEEAELKTLPTKEFDIGRYDVVMEGGVVSDLVAATLGPATQLDRALGMEANTRGTSYLGPDVLGLLGNFKVGSPCLTLTANRSTPFAPATVKWDAEGVEPEEATLVKEGILTDYQTTREEAGWLAPYYEKAGKPVRSHGYAGAEDALECTRQVPPNLVLESGRQPVPGLEMIKSIKKGLYIFGDKGIDTDFQNRAGECHVGGSPTEPGVREIVNGKLGALISGGGVIQFRTQELWDNLVAVGPASEAHAGGIATIPAWLALVGSIFSQAGSGASHVTAPPAQFHNLTIVRS